MKILAAIANYGTKNDRYLYEVIENYRSMPFETDVVVISNIPKDLGPDIEVCVVNFNGADPHTLPFAHKRLMADRLTDYDLFIYSEDDTLISERNLEAFWRVSAVVRDDEIPGFLNTECDGNGELHFPNMHDHFFWDPKFLVTRDQYRFGHFTNEHSASFAMTRDQLRRAIDSGGFLVAPHQGRYNWACSAATDPYTQCSFKKLICISHLEDFLIRHLPNKYYQGRPYGTWDDLRRQIEALEKVHADGATGSLLFKPETKLPEGRWSKSYYESVDTRAISLVPEGARNVLSIGCAWGATEGELVKQGLPVTAVPMDAVIAACAQAKGIEVVHGDFKVAREKLAGQSFDTILLLNVLHLLPDPIEVLRTFSDLLSLNGVVLARVPNLGLASLWAKRGRHRRDFPDLQRGYVNTGLHMTSAVTLRRWFHDSGLKVSRVLAEASDHRQAVTRWTFGLAAPLIAEELIAIGRRPDGHIRPVRRNI